MDCLFCKIINNEIPGDKVFEDDQVLAFNDINPQGPTHVLIVPKQHITTINDITPQNNELLGHMLNTAKNIAFERNISTDGYRLIFNVNVNGGQAVYHIHLHLIGGRAMNWPPG